VSGLSGQRNRGKGKRVMRFWFGLLIGGESIVAGVFMISLGLYIIEKVYLERISEIQEVERKDVP
jgi:hypothetical protein